jgi:murein DD-endopeptidase MepM/ murein hydrolase activator NlpD
VTRLAGVVLLASLSACATDRAGTTWADDAREGVGAHSPPIAEPAAKPDPKAPPTYGVRMLPRDDADASQELELLLLRFTAKRRQLSSDDAIARAAKTQSGAWPKSMEAAWTAVLGELEQGFQRPAGSVPRRLLIQSRVTLEVELDQSQARYGSAPPAIVERIARLFAVIAVHMRASSPMRDERPRLSQNLALTWPLSPVIVTSPFGYRRDPILGRSSVRFHAGVDLGGSSGDVVHAAGSGHIVSAGWLGGHGRSVIIQHPGGYQTIYAHLNRILVPIGGEVDARSPIGFVGSSGRSTGPHLHFEIRHGGVPLDPLDVVDMRSTAENEDREAARARAVEHASR